MQVLKTKLLYLKTVQQSETEVSYLYDEYPYQFQEARFF